MYVLVCLGVCVRANLSACTSSRARARKVDALGLYLLVRVFALVSTTAFGRRIVHYDIKGANVLVDRSGVCKLSDFGAARRLEDITTAASGPASLRGTPYWMAPEVVRQSASVGAPADIWSLACTVIEMATGQPPWADVETPIAVLYHIATTKAPPALPPWLSPDALDFLGRCFTSRPEARPTAAELLQHPFLRAAGAVPVPTSEPVHTGSSHWGPAIAGPAFEDRGGGGVAPLSPGSLMHRVVQSPSHNFLHDAPDVPLSPPSPRASSAVTFSLWSRKAKLVVAVPRRVDVAAAANSGGREGPAGAREERSEGDKRTEGGVAEPRQKLADPAVANKFIAGEVRKLKTRLSSQDGEIYAVRVLQSARARVVCVCV
jgi:serine/threonine protein kinase